MAPPCTCADTKELSTMFILSCAAFMNHKSEPKMCMRHMKAHCPRPVVPQQVCSRYAMLRERHRRGTLACALCASILGWCFVAPRTETRPMPRCPVRAAAGETKSGSNFWGAAQKAAGNNKTDVEAYIAETKTRAGQHMNSSQVVDRDEAVKALVQSMESTGLLTLVLGGKNLGKTFLKQAALRACSSNVVVVSADMRDMPGTSLLNAILLTANKTLKERTGDNDVGQYVPSWLGIISAAVLTIEGLGPAASPVGAFIKDMAGIATSRRKVRSAIDAFLSRVRASSKRSAIVVDEANLGLPGLTNGQDVGERGEAKSALAAITAWTKQGKLTSVLLISSEFAYPFRLQATGLDLRDIGRVIVIGEVPKYDMLKMLQHDWGMDENLANIFYTYFGGDIYTTKQALDSLVEKKDNFNPFAVVDCPGLPSCVEDPEARAHLENIAKQGFSPVRNVKTDKGARMIAEENVGGIIKEDAITFDLPDIFTNTSCEWAVIPSSYHMRLKIADKLKNIFPSGSAAPQRPPAVWVCQLGSPDGKNFEVIGNPFQVKGVLANVDDLKKAIDPSLSAFQASKIDIYRRKDGGWFKEDEESAVGRLLWIHDSSWSCWSRIV
ncbi:unnamed protein product [Effrenium voratum]|nr:unnamed protein product [Effrenium voratum]